MNLQPVVAHRIDANYPQWLKCSNRNCRADFRLHEGYADLDGKAFEAYYCGGCGRATTLRAKLAAERSAQ